MNAAVMIIVLVTGGQDAVAIHHVEFTTVKACLKAANEVAGDALKQLPAGVRLVVNCHSR